MRITRIVLVILAAIAQCRAQGVITTVVGNGTNGSTGDGGAATSAAIRPNGVTVDNAGNIYIADLAKSVIRKVNTAGIITTVAGTGDGKTQFTGDGVPATTSTIYIASNHNGLAVDAEGNLYIADDGHHRIRKVNRDGIISTVAGNGKQGFSGDGGPATDASLWRPSAVALDSAGNLYIADTLNARIRKVDTAGIITTIAGNGSFGSTGDGGPATDATMFYPMGVCVDGAGDIYVADQNAYNVRKITPAGAISTVAGSGAFGFAGDGGPAVKADLAGLYSVAADGLGNIYIADHGNHRVRKVDQSGIITTVAGGQNNKLNDDGPPTSANIEPVDVAFDSAGNYYIADQSNNRIRKVTLGALAPGLSVSAHALYFSGIAGGNTPATQNVNVTTLGTVPLGLSVSHSTSDGGDWLAASIPGSAPTPTFLTVSINATGLQTGKYEGAITLTPVAPDLPKIIIPVTLSLASSAGTRPTIEANGVQNGASFLPGLTPGAWVTIKGTNLASTTDTWDHAVIDGNLPTSLDGVTVLINSRPAYIQYISPTQINLVVPDPNTNSSSTSVLVNNNGASATSSFIAPLKPLAPAFFPWPGNQVVATRQDYTWAVKDGTFAGVPTTAAKPGDVLILWGTGFGPTTPTAPPGVVVPADRTYSTSSAVTVTINNQPATVYGAALASGFAAVYQVAIQVPESLADGDWPIVASVGSVSSPSTLLSVKK